MEQHTGERDISPSHRSGVLRFQSENVVVVLGVMYPSVLPQLGDSSAPPDLPLPPSGIDKGRQIGEVIFYDPFSSEGNGHEVSFAEKYRKKSHVYRAEAQKAVSRDLALLSLRKRG